MNAITNITSDSKTARRLLGFIEEFRKLSPDMQAQQIVIFLHVAGAPDAISMKDLERKSGLSSSATSRNVLALSEWYKKGVAGHDLVEHYEDPDNRRSKLVRLKPKGKRVYNTLIQLLGS